MSKVSRSVYQKLKEENKKLLRDIKTLVGPVNKNRINTFRRWQNYFRNEKEFNTMMKEVATKIILKNPELYPDFLVNKAKENKANPEID